MDTDKHGFYLSVFIGGVLWTSQFNGPDFPGVCAYLVFFKKNMNLLPSAGHSLYRRSCFVPVYCTQEVPMRILLFTFSVFLLLQQTGFADVPINYYVSPGGVDANNTCTNSGTPCHSIKKVLKQVTHTKSFINIARGAYTEAGMEILPGQNVTFVGGWVRNL